MHGVWKDAEACGVEVVLSIEAISWNHDEDSRLIMEFVAGEHRWTLDHTSGLLTFIIAPFELDQTVVKSGPSWTWTYWKQLP